MKILFIGDPHLKISRLDISKKFLAWINDLVISVKPDLVVNLGDSFDTHAVIRSEIMTEFMRHVFACTKVCRYIYLVGNHDQYKPNDSAYHALSHIKGKINNFIIVDDTSVIDNITFVPYKHESSLFPLRTTPICVAHQTFIGADYGHLIAKDGVDPSTIQGVSLIVSGHIHKRQELAFNNVRVKYPGSPYAQSASDVGETKGVIILNTDDMSEQFIECPLPKWRSLDLEIKENFDLQSAHEVLLKSINNMDNFIVTLKGPKIEIMAYLESDKYKEIANNKLKIKTLFTDKHK